MSELRPFRDDERTSIDALANALYVTVVNPDLTWWDDLVPDAQDAWRKAAGRVEASLGALDVDRLAQAMVDGLSDGGVVRIDADGWKELRDVAASIAAAYSGATRSSSGAGT